MVVVMGELSAAERARLYRPIGDKSGTHLYGIKADQVADFDVGNFPLDLHFAEPAF